MTSPWASLGLPCAVLDAAQAQPLLRYTLLALAVLWAFLARRGRLGPTLLGGLAFAWVVLAFWSAGFARPYGLLELGAPSREAAYAVQASLAAEPRGFVAGEPFRGGPWAELGARVLPLRALALGPSLLPFLTLPLPALLVALLWRRPEATLAAAALLAFATSDLEALRGTGYVPGLWMHPAASLGVGLLLAGLLLASRSGRTAKVSGALLAVAGVWLCRAPFAEPLALHSLPGVALLDPWPWPLLAAFGLRAPRDRAASACLLAGACGLAACASGAPLDAWSAFAVWRFGLMLAASGPLLRLLQGLAALVVRGLPRLAGQAGLGLALLLLVGLPGAFLTWWAPYKLDPWAYTGTLAVPAELVEVTSFMRAELPPTAVVAASAQYAAAVAVLAERQVLRAPGLLLTADDEDRALAERTLFARGRRGARNALRYGVSHVLLGPGDGRRGAFGATASEPLPARFRLLFEHPKGFRVYALERRDGAD